MRRSALALTAGVVAWAAVVACTTSSAPTQGPGDDAGAWVPDATTQRNDPPDATSDGDLDGQVVVPEAGPDACAAIACKLGSCFEGQCFCGKDAFVQPDGTCGLTPPGSCTAQGGTCHSHPASCPDGQTMGAMTATKSCGDFAPAECCFTCQGPTDFVCCGTPDAGDGAEVVEAVCENGHRTCPDGRRPVHGSLAAPPSCAL